MSDMRTRDRAGSPMPVSFLLLAALLAVDAKAQTPPAVSHGPRATVIPGAIMPNYRAIVQLAAPAVVGITVTGSRKVSPQDWMPWPDEEPFSSLFKNLPRGTPPGERPFRGQGSGFIITPDGLVLTSAHVIQGAEQILVRLSDRREFKAQVLGADPLTDVAVLRVAGSNLPVVRLGRVDDLQVGDPVLAIGAPYGLEQTATQGIVSAKGRALPGESLVTFIQTDAAVNPGNSGGPLLDASGSVVGINAQIYSQSGGYQGLSFAIPIEVALRVKDQIVAHGRAQHARLGVSIQNLNQSLARSFGLDLPNGALVVGVARDSAARSAGLMAGDVITSVNGQRIDNAGDLGGRLALMAPGDTVQLTVWRNRAQRTVSVKLGRASDDTTTTPEQPVASPGQLGLRMRPLTSAEREAASLDGGGLMIVESTGQAALAGVQVGDVLLAVNGTPVSSVEQVRAIVARKPAAVALLIDRDGERLFVPVELD
ncbi:peptidase Do family protein [Hydrogenophaga sp. RAC07]|uniref:Do family serine endopeptidase n=1 Tax=Hydrogenophaga sp. RAC07 TaxID=1842537 RepID=UPI0008560D4F|nr:Do family serine endopeptidase [Hydrogenophaga sp. RAC07]AOF87435.1 peptidase Do family protein [Hydrogenophaga sp. RAC07]